MCSLGGYTSRLLGYRTRLYSLCQDSNCSEDIDIIMFGKAPLVVFVSEILCDNYPARACASKGLCDRSWRLYIYCCIL